jgi:hypothetical protein
MPALQRQALGYQRWTEEREQKDQEDQEDCRLRRRCRQTLSPFLIFPIFL